MAKIRRQCASLQGKKLARKSSVNHEVMTEKDRECWLTWKKSITVKFSAFPLPLSYPSLAPPTKNKELKEKERWFKCDIRAHWISFTYTSGSPNAVRLWKRENTMERTDVTLKRTNFVKSKWRPNYVYENLIIALKLLRKTSCIHSFAFE